MQGSDISHGCIPQYQYEIHMILMWSYFRHIKTYLTTGRTTAQSIKSEQISNVSNLQRIRNPSYKDEVRYLQYLVLLSGSW